MVNRQIVGLVAVLVFGSAAQAGEEWEKVMKVPPAEAAESAAAQQDFRYMSAPSCFNGVPGYSGPGFPEPWPPKRAWKSCEDIVGPTMVAAMRELEGYAKEYNLRMHSLRVGHGVDKE
jgi:hypothetical protein